MMRKKHHLPAHNSRAEAPDNLLDLNRSLTGYAYQPVAEPKGSEGELPVKQADKIEPSRKPWKKIMLWCVGISIIVSLFTGGWVAWKLLANQIKIFGWGGLFSLFQKTTLQGEAEGHVNILLAGNSADDANHGGATLTDSIMVISLNTKTNTAFMLSIPRDLYVDIPGQGYAKINEAYQDGERNSFSEPGFAKGGMGLLQKTVSKHFGLPLHYYALVDYAAVRDAVNAVGGVTVTIDSPDPRGLYDPSPDLNNNRQPLVKLSNGSNKLNGTQALALVRARGNAFGAYGYGTGDFQRTKNQQLLLLGLRDRVISAGTLANPLKLGELFDSFGDNVDTDLTLGEVRRAYELGKNVPERNITAVSLNDVEGSNLLASYRTPIGQSALIPRAGIDDFSEIQTYLEKLLNPPVPTPDTSSN